MIAVREEYCPQNHACPVLHVCPTQALSQKGFSAPVVNEELCIKCCKCTRNCRAFVGVDCCVDR